MIKKGFTLNIEKYEQDSFKINLFHTTEERNVGYITFRIISDSEIDTSCLGVSTRRTEPIIAPSLHIVFLYIKDKFRGLQLANMLLSIAISYTSVVFSYVKYMTLENDSDLAESERNIYTSFMFVPCGTIAYDMSKKGSYKGLPGPEMVGSMLKAKDKLLFNNSEKVNLMIQKFEERIRSKLKGGKTKKNKTKKNKTKKNKTTRRKKKL